MFFDILLALAAYFAGAIPSAYLFGRLFKGLDIRRVGSGNVGAMNTLKEVGCLPGALTLLLDAGKGALAVYLAAALGNWPLLPLLAALLAITGHNFNIFLKFKGGKGLGTLAGSLLMLSPLTVVFILPLAGLLALLLRDTNTAMGLTVLTLPLFWGIQKGEWAWCVAGAAISLVVVVKHLGDFQAYRQGRRKLF